jgi:hypothetical protein
MRESGNGAQRIIASEASNHSLRAKLARTNKAKFYLRTEGKVPCYIPPSPVNSCPLPSKMYI